MLETNKLGEKLFADVNSRLDKAGLMMHGGTIVDASLIAAPKSTKNQEGKRDPEMHQTKKGNEWYFGMKVHAAVDAGSGYVHTITGTSANMHDVTETANLIRKDDEKKSKIEFRVNKRPSSLKMADDFKGFNWEKKWNMKSPPFAVRLSTHFSL